MFFVLFLQGHFPHQFQVCLMFCQDKMLIHPLADAG